MHRLGQFARATHHSPSWVIVRIRSIIGNNLTVIDIVGGIINRNKKRTLENLEGGDIELTPEELQEIDEVLNTHTIAGGRYIDELETRFNLWG